MTVHTAAPARAAAAAPPAGGLPSGKATASGRRFAHALHHAAHRHHHTHHHRHHAPHAQAVGATAEAAVDQAMAAEAVPSSWRHSLLFIVAQESGGRVGVKNSTDSARGLFQLTRASWHLNPNGAASFGHGVEEARGGIRYIEARYATAPAAETFWRAHGWY